MQNDAANCLVQFCVENAASQQNLGAELALERKLHEVRGAVLADVAACGGSSIATQSNMRTIEGHELQVRLLLVDKRHQSLESVVANLIHCAA